MFDFVLSKSTKNFLQKLKSNSLPKGSYLGSGTALALWLGHRKSVDLDFFIPSAFSETQWEQKLKREFDFKITYTDWQTLVGYIKDIKFSLFGYQYKILDKLAHWQDMYVAGLSDLSSMKLDTVIKRGTKRDFIDLYFLAKRFSLQKMFGFFQKKYGNLEDMKLILKKSLIFFDDAEKDEMPEMLTDIEWKNVKNYFLSEVKKISYQRLS